ncbi:hypothetical protein [Caldiplasma sukawensis]
MNRNILLLISIVLSLIFFIFFYLSISSPVGYLLFVLSLFFFVISIIDSITMNYKKSDLRKFSIVKFIFPLFSGVAFLMSSGIISKISGISPPIDPTDVNFLSLLYVFPFIYLILVSGYETSGKIKFLTSRSGYEEDEIRIEMDAFSGHLIFIALISLGTSLLSLLFLILIPSLNIGLIPALILFLSVYLMAIILFFRRGEIDED